MKSGSILFLLIFIAALGSGCATNSHFSKLPTQEEFAKPLPRLKQEYPDLTRYESPGIFVTYNMPVAGALKDAWGEPHSTGFSARMLFPPVWVFHPSRYWYWEFEGKMISALIDRPLFFRHQPHVFKLEVVERKKS